MGNEEKAIAQQSSDLSAILGITEDTPKAIVAVMGGGGDFMPRIQLMTASNPEVKQGKFKGINHMALVEGEALTDLGEGVDALVLQVRPLAIDKNGLLANGETGIIFCNDAKLDGTGKPTGLYKKIMDKSLIKDSGAFYGPEFLLYIPQIKKYATFLMGSKTARNDSHTLVSRLGKAVTIRGHEIPNKKYGNYFSPEGVPCSTVFELPPAEEILAKVETFKNPVNAEAGTEATPEEKKATDAAR